MAEKRKELSAADCGFCKGLCIDYFDCCKSRRDARLLKLSAISLCLDDMMGGPFIENEVDDSINEAESAKRAVENVFDIEKARITKPRLNNRMTIQFFLESMSNTDPFVVYRSSKIFLKYFTLYPKTLEDHLEASAEHLANVLKCNRLAFVDILFDVMKQIRKELKRINNWFSLMSGKHFIQLRVLKRLLEVYSSIESSSLLSANSTENSTQYICTLRMTYQAKKLLRICCSKSNRGNSFEEESHQPAINSSHGELDQFVSQLNLLIQGHRFSFDTILGEGRFATNETFLMMKILSLDLQFSQDHSNERKELANTILSQFLDLNCEHIFIIKSIPNKDFTKEKTIEPVAENDYKSWRSLNTRMLILVLLESCLVSLDSQRQKPSSATDSQGLAFRNIQSILSKLARLLQSNSRCNVNQNMRKLGNENLSSSDFAEGLINAMIDEDDQLCLSVAILLKIYNHFAAEKPASGLFEKFDSSASQFIDDDFPHRIMCCLLRELSFDHMVGIDWLICDETCFHELLSLYLEIILSNFNFFKSCLVAESKGGEDASKSSDRSYVIGEMEDDFVLRNKISQTKRIKYGAKNDFSFDENGLMSNMYAEKQNDSYNGHFISESNDNVQFKHSSQSCFFTSNGGIKPILMDQEDSYDETKRMDIYNEGENYMITREKLKDSEINDDTLKQGEISSQSRNNSEKNICYQVTPLVDYEFSSESEDDSQNVEKGQEQGFGQNYEREERTENVCYDRLDSSGTVSETSSCDNCYEMISASCEEVLQKRPVDEIMDFFIRLRLKLERISEHNLTLKCFEDLIGQLLALEEKFDASS